MRLRLEREPKATRSGTRATRRPLIREASFQRPGTCLLPSFLHHPETINLVLLSFFFVVYFFLSPYLCTADPLVVPVSMTRPILSQSKRLSSERYSNSTIHESNFSYLFHYSCVVCI